MSVSFKNTQLYFKTTIPIDDAKKIIESVSDDESVKYSLMLFFLNDVFEIGGFYFMKRHSVLPRMYFNLILLYFSNHWHCLFIYNAFNLFLSVFFYRLC